MTAVSRCTNGAVAVGAVTVEKLAARLSSVVSLHPHSYADHDVLRVCEDARQLNERVRAESILALSLSARRLVDEVIKEVDRWAKSIYVSARTETAVSAVMGSLLTLQEEIEHFTEREIAPLRRALVDGSLSRDEFKREIADRARRTVAGSGRREEDIFLHRLLGLPDAPASTPTTEIYGANPFISTTAAMVQRFIGVCKPKKNDIIYDLGCGVGFVTILCALLSDARSRGIEIRPDLAERGIEAIAKNRIPRCEIMVGDVRRAALSDGTIFHLYAPFYGTVLKEVAHMLDRLAAEKPIKIFCHGAMERVFDTMPHLKGISRGESAFLAYQSA